MKFVKADGEFDVVGYKAAIRTLITAQEIIVDNASYPTPSDRRRTATPTGRSASATRTWARC